MAKNLISGQILAPLALIWVPKFFSRILPLLDVRHCCKLMFYSISMKTNKPNLRKWKKLVLGQILAHLTQIRAADFFFFFFSKIWLRQSLDIIVSYHYVQNQKKLIFQSWVNLVTDGQTDRRTDRQTDNGRKWFHRVLSD